MRYVAGMPAVRPMVAFVVAVAVLVAGCGSGSPTLTEYSERLEALGADLSTELDVLDERMSAGEPSVADAMETLSRAVEARTEFQDGITALEPPAVLETIHNDLVDLHARVIAAQEDWADAAGSAGSLAELEQDEAAVAFRSLLDDAVAACHDIQERLDATAERETAAGTPWVPVEMKEVVEVALGC